MQQGPSRARSLVPVHWGCLCGELCQQPPRLGSGGWRAAVPAALCLSLQPAASPRERRRTAGLVPPLPRRHGDVEERRGPGMCSAPHCRLRFPQVPPKGCCVLAPCLHPTTPAPPCSGEPGGQSLRGHRGQGQPGPGTRKGQHRQLCKQGGTLALRAH